MVTPIQTCVDVRVSPDGAVSRRGFLRWSALASLGMGLFPRTSRAQRLPQAKAEVRRYVPLGNTGIKMSDISFGASPRGPISLVQSARALALVRGRDYVLAEDLQTLAKDALRHRLVLTYQALAEEVSADTILDSVLEAVPLPTIDLARTTAA